MAISVLEPASSELRTADLIEKVKSEAFPALEDFDNIRITAEKELPNSPPVVTIGGAPFASNGNISVISAVAKAGKTAFTGVILAGAIKSDCEGFPEVQVSPNIYSRAVIQIDTEQAAIDHQYNVKTVLRRCGLDKTPDCLRCYNLRETPVSEMEKVTEQIARLSFERFGGIHLMVIDGAADYIPDVNDPAASKNIIHFFTRLSVQYDCPVILIIHQNPGNGLNTSDNKERGHLGSEAQRKCYGLISISKDKDISTAKPKIMRKAGLSQVPLVSFTYSQEKGFHVPVDPVEVEIDNAERKRLNALEIAKRVFSPPSALTYTEAYTSIMKETSLKERSAKGLLKEMEGWEQIEKGVDNKYRLII